LHEASKNCGLEICDILLHRGASPNVTNTNMKNKHERKIKIKQT